MVSQCWLKLNLSGNFYDDNNSKFSGGFVRLNILLLSVVLVGCMSSSGVVMTGDDTYMISRSEKGFDATGARVKADAIKEANDYCSLKGKNIKLVSSSHQDMKPFRADAQATIEFKCVAQD